MTNPKSSVHASPIPVTQGELADLAPESYLPSQVPNRIPVRSLGSVRLCVIILRDALYALNGNGRATAGAVDKRHRQAMKRKQAEEAREWVLSPDDRWLYSFLRVCEVLKLDPWAVRKRALSGKLAIDKGCGSWSDRDAHERRSA